MLYTFDLGNVIVNTDFNRILGAWSDPTRIPLVTPRQHFTVEEAFYQHERGEISDEGFAVAMCHEMNMSLSCEQFARDWQAVFVALRPEVIVIIHKLHTQGRRVVVPSNTNRLHTVFRLDEYPEVRAAADRIYLSQEMGLRKPEAEVYLRVLKEEGSSATDTVFFDDNVDNVAGTNRLRITSVLVAGKKTIPGHFANQLCQRPLSRNYATIPGRCWPGLSCRDGALVRTT